MTARWYQPGELIDHTVEDLDNGKTPEQVIHEEITFFQEAADSGEPPNETLDEFIRFMLDEFERARHFFARCQIAAVYALAQAERGEPE